MPKCRYFGSCGNAATHFQIWPMLEVWWLCDRHMKLAATGGGVIIGKMGAEHSLTDEHKALVVKSVLLDKPPLFR